MFGLWNLSRHEGRVISVPTAILVLVADGRRWFIPARAVEARTGRLLGGPKYAEFEIDRGRPLPSRDQP